MSTERLRQAAAKIHGAVSLVDSLSPLSTFEEYGRAWTALHNCGFTSLPVALAVADWLEWTAVDPHFDDPEKKASAVADRILGGAK